MSAKKAKSKGDLKIRPLGDRLLVRPDEEEAEKVGSLYIPDAAKEKPQQGTIVALGTGRKDEEGNVIPFEVSIDDNVMYGKYSGTEIKIDGEPYMMMRESDLLAVIN